MATYTLTGRLRFKFIDGYERVLLVPEGVEVGAPLEECLSEELDNKMQVYMQHGCTVSCRSVRITVEEIGEEDPSR